MNEIENSAIKEEATLENTEISNEGETKTSEVNTANKKSYKGLLIAIIGLALIVICIFAVKLLSKEEEVFQEKADTVYDLTGDWKAVSLEVGSKNAYSYEGDLDQLKEDYGYEVTLGVYGNTYELVLGNQSYYGKVDKISSSDINSKYFFYRSDDSLRATGRFISEDEFEFALTEKDRITYRRVR